MKDRNQKLLNIRPEVLSTTIKANMGNDERFQNVTLIPIIKLQHDLLLEVFKNYIVKHKSVFYGLSIEEKQDYIDTAIHKDMKFRNSLKGMIIGLFTTNEYKLYIKNSSALNKRMMSIVKEKLLNNIQVFEREELLVAI